MTTKTWNFALEGQPHTLTLEHTVLSGEHSILLDGQLLEKFPRNISFTGGSHEYQLEGHSLVILIQEKFPSYSYDLLIDGVSRATGKQESKIVKSNPLFGTAIVAAMLICFGIFVSWFIKNSVAIIMGIFIGLAIFILVFVWYMTKRDRK